MRDKCSFCIHASRATCLKKNSKREERPAFRHNCRLHESNFAGCRSTIPRPSSTGRTMNMHGGRSALRDGTSARSVTGSPDKNLLPAAHCACSFMRATTAFFCTFQKALRIRASHAMSTRQNRGTHWRPPRSQVSKHQVNLQQNHRRRPWYPLAGSIRRNYRGLTSARKARLAE